MTVSTTYTQNGPYTGTGVITNLPFNFPVLSSDDLDVALITVSDGTSVLLTKVTDYSVTLYSGGSGGGYITPTTAYSSSYQIMISRNTPETQELDIQTDAGFFPTDYETAFDKLTMLVQELVTTAGNALLKSVSGLFWDFQNLPGRNCADPTNAQDVDTKAARDAADAVTLANAVAQSKSYTDSLIAALVTGGAILATSYPTTVSHGDTYLDVPFAVGTFTAGLLFIGGSTYNIATDTTISDDGSGNIRMTFNDGAIVGDHNVIVVMYN